MQIVIAGAGSVGRSIAKELISHGHKVTLVDNKAARIEVSDVAEADWVLADICSLEALEKADIKSADVLVSATGNDKVNLVASLLAKSEYGVPKTVARVNNPKNEWMFNDTWGVDVAVSTPRIMTALVEEAVSVGVPVPLFTFHSSGAQMFSLTVPEECPLIGQNLGSVQLPVGTVLASVLRDTYPLPPHCDTTLEAGDELLFLLAHNTQSDLEYITSMFNGSDNLLDPERED